jgi:hypothetical protein
MAEDTGPEPESNRALPIIWLAAGVYAVARGWARGWPWFVAMGLACLAVGGGLFWLQRSERFRKWEPRVNLVLFVLLIVAMFAVCGLDLTRTLS